MQDEILKRTARGHETALTPSSFFYLKNVLFTTQFFYNFMDSFNPLTPKDF
jgi:hypothetical protein